MVDRKTLPRSRLSYVPAVLVPHLKLGALTLLAAAPILLVMPLVPRAMLLPTLSLAAVALAAIAGLAAWRFRARRHSNTVTLWDVAGACALIGCAAAMLSDPETILTTLGHDLNP